MKILSLCDYTGNMIKPWIENGHECHIVDLQHKGISVGGGMARIQADVCALAELDYTGYDLVFAFPPCTHLAVSGARWFKDKGLDALVEAIKVFSACIKICERNGAPYMIENPVSTISTYWRKPDYTFDPCEYGAYLNPPGDEYTKKTCLWVGNGFVMPEKRPVRPVLGSKIHLMPPTDDRANLRSETPLGFAYAVYEYNKTQTSKVACI